LSMYFVPSYVLLPKTPKPHSTAISHLNERN